MLSCNVVKDLLPSYIEGLVSEETAREIETHLAECADCRSEYEQMTAPMEMVITQEEKELDYLKKVRTKNRLRVLYSAISIPILLVVIMFTARFFPSEILVNSADFDFAIYRYEADYFNFMIDMRLTNGHSLVSEGFDFEFNHLGLVNRFILSPRQTWRSLDLMESLFSLGFAAYDEPVADDFLFIIRLEDQDIVFTLEEMLAMPNLSSRSPLSSDMTYTISSDMTYLFTRRKPSSTGPFTWYIIIFHPS